MGLYDAKDLLGQNGTFILEYYCMFYDLVHTLREESSHTNVILQYKLLAAILSAACSVIQQ